MLNRNAHSFCCARVCSLTALEARAACPSGFLLQLDQAGRFFIGELSSREQPHGRGSSFFANGRLEVSLLSDPSKHGRWIHGAVSGRALKQLQNGDRLEGFFSDDALQGVVSVQRASSAIPIEEALLHLPDGKEEKKEDGGPQGSQSAAAAARPAASSQ